MKKTIRTRNHGPIWWPLTPALALLIAGPTVACGGDEDDFLDKEAFEASVEVPDLDVDRPDTDDDEALGEQSEWPRACGPGGAVDLSCLQQAVVGRWSGSVAPARGPSYSIEITFDGNGSYEARCPAFGASGPGLCLEVDGEETARTYELVSVEFDGTASGRIESPQQSSFSFITDLRLSEDETRMVLKIWSPWSGEEVRPIWLELRRVLALDQ